MSKVIRTVKNVTKGYSNTQVKVRNATSNDPWGPTGTEMSDIARMTFDTTTDFFEIMDMLDKRLNDKGKNWRHVLKALKVLDYCLHEGSEHVVVWAKDNIYIIKTLREFQYVDEEGKDQGMNVRVSAKELTSLLLDEERLRNERKDRKSWKSRVSGIEDSASSNGYPGRSSERQRPRRHSNPGPSARTDEEDLEYRLAIEASKNQAEEDKKRQSQSNVPDDDLAKAIRLSKEEAERERAQKEQGQINADSLFDDAPVQQQAQPLQYQQTAFQQQPDYQQGQMVDFWGNPMNQQNTGYLNGVYGQPTGQFANQQQFPQPTGFDMQQAMQQQQQLQQQQQMQQQQQQMQQPQGYGQQMVAQPTGFAAQNPYANGGNLSPQQTAYMSPGNNNPYANGLQPAQPMVPLPTGSNNPFAPKMSYGTQSPPRNNGQPSLAALQEQRTQTPSFSQFQQQSQQTAFGQQPSFSSPSTPVPTQQQQQPAKPINPQHAQLEALLAGGNGLDTFGNTGDLRIPAQHTAPGMFVNSAGMRRGPTPAQATGNNPWMQQTQFTGMPQTTGFGASLQPQQQRLVPAHTGPAGMTYQGGNANPFGQPQQQQQQNQNLIDF
ncbi:hypothetical protein BZA05DRAFT_22762 [Tricharina praecox]|uniref:uncharacterized protein n=1 Tax=Tricharina praecox TaxID=43433 RepID=UPI00221E710E|nr:uncharacterized protein BZA05DRAFT_22762 [Tricharina praecox]KAI5859157.1 hypothetical protein BZA05DRAFT_22762 [Tricharina praecox]